MDHHRRLSNSSVNSRASDRSIEQPPSCKSDGRQPEDISPWKLKTELKRSIEELKSDFDRNHQTLSHKIKKLIDVTDELESVHKNSTAGRFVGSSIGAAGGIASIARLVLAQLTLGASLALTAAVIGVAEGA